ncbi:MAG: GumC family protein, partial [Planctomycetia bacterium]
MNENYPNTTNGNGNGALNNQEEQGTDIRVYLYKLLHFWPWLLLGLSVGLTGAYLMNRYATPRYQVQADIVLKDPYKDKSQDPVNFTGMFLKTYDMEAYESEVAVLNSAPILQRALEQLPAFGVEFTGIGRIATALAYPNPPGFRIEIDSLHPQLSGISMELEAQEGGVRIMEVGTAGESKDAVGVRAYLPLDFSWLEGLDSIARPNAGRYAFGQWIEGAHYRFRFVRTDKPVGTLENYRLSLRHPEAMLKSHKVESAWFKKGSPVLLMTAESPSVDKAQDLVEALIEVYTDYVLDMKNASTSRSLAFVNEMLGTINDSLLQVEGKKEAFRSNNKTFSLSNEGGAVFSRLQELDKEVLRVQEQQRYYAYLRKYLQEASSFDEVVSPSVSLVEDPLVGELVKELSKLYDERRMAQSGLRKDNPMLERIDLKIRVLRDNLLENLKNALSAAALKEKELQVRLRDAEGALSQLPRTERELLGIERKVAITSELYNFLLKRRAEMGIARAATQSDVRVVEPPRMMKKTFPNTGLNLLIGAMIGLLIPVGVVFGRDYFQNTLLDRTEIERGTRMPVIGVVGRNIKDTNMVVLEHPKSAMSEAFRALRTNLQYINPGAEKKVVLITSSISGEGKTFTSLNMASILSLGGKRVVLMGVDLRKPKMFDDLGLSNQKGISTYLAGKHSKEEIVQHTGRGELYFVSAGPVP